MSFNLPRLYVVADLAFVGDQEAWLRKLALLGHAWRGNPGAIAVQVRAKQLEPAPLELAAKLARKALGEGVLAVLNGPASLARKLGFGGVHWPQAQIPATRANAAAPSFRSAAVHSVEAIRRAKQAGASAVAFAPVFQPAWKPAAAAGLEGLREAAAATVLPTYALGGVTVERVGPCLRHGAYGIAAASGVMGAANPAAAAQRYLDAIAATRPQT